MRAGGYVEGLRAEGMYAAKDARAAGYTCAEMKIGGYGALELREAGFSPLECKAAGVAPAELWPLVGPDRRAGRVGEAVIAEGKFGIVQYVAVPGNHYLEVKYEDGTVNDNLSRPGHPEGCVCVRPLQWIKPAWHSRSRGEL